MLTLNQDHPQKPPRVTLGSHNARIRRVKAPTGKYLPTTAQIAERLDAIPLREQFRNMRDYLRPPPEMLQKEALDHYFAVRRLIPLPEIAIPFPDDHTDSALDDYKRLIERQELWSKTQHAIEDRNAWVQMRVLAADAWLWMMDEWKMDRAQVC